MNRPRRTVGVLLMAVGVLLVGTAIFLIVRNSYLDRAAGVASADALEKIDAYISENADATAPTDLSDDPDAGYEILTVGTAPFFGTIDIPAADIRLPLIDVFSYDYLDIAPCRYRGSIAGDDLVIIAHNYASHFGRLSSLGVTDRVQITLLSGTPYAYTVVDTEEINGYDVERLDEGEWDLTLFTCDPSGQYRHVIRCQRI